LIGNPFRSKQLSAIRDVLPECDIDYLRR
jgi:hypothetical protein